MPRKPVRFRLTTLFGLTAVWAISFGSLSRGPGAFFFISTVLFTSFAYWFSYRELHLRFARAQAIGFVTGTMWGVAAVAVISIVRDEVPLGAVGFLIGAALGGVTSLLPLICLSLLRESQEPATWYDSPGTVDRHHHDRATWKEMASGLWDELRVQKHERQVIYGRRPHRRFRWTGLLLALITLMIVCGLVVALELDLFIVAFSVVVTAAACFAIKKRWRRSTRFVQWLAPLIGVTAGLFVLAWEDLVNFAIPFRRPEYWYATIAGAASSLLVVAGFNIARRGGRRRSRGSRRRRSASAHAPQRGGNLNRHRMQPECRSEGRRSV